MSDMMEKVLKIFAEEFDLYGDVDSKVRGTISRTLFRLKSLLEAEPSVIVPIQSLADLEVIQPIMAVVRQEDGVFVASWFDVNIHASGETEGEAIEMLKEMIVWSFETLPKEENKLGKMLQKQLAVLRQFVRAQPKPPKGREERVEEVKEIICEMVSLSPYTQMRIADQIVATEPSGRMMSREEMVMVVANYYANKSPCNLCFAEMVKKGNPGGWNEPGGALIAIDALAGQIPASNEAKRLDRLDRICEKLGKVPRNRVGEEVYMRLLPSGCGEVRRGIDLLCVFGLGEDPEQVIDEYVAKLDKPSDLTCELKTLCDGYPVLRKLGEKELEKAGR